MTTVPKLLIVRERYSQGAQGANTQLSNTQLSSVECTVSDGLALQGHGFVDVVLVLCLGHAEKGMK